MKNIKTIFTLVVFAGLFSCKAQQTIASLKQIEDCGKRPESSIEPCPGMENVTSVKDVDNRLNVFEGTWKGSYNGKQIELNLVKKTDFENYDMKWDQLNGKIRVKDNQGNIILDSFNNPDIDANPYGYNFQGAEYVMRFTANGDCYDEGKIFLQVQQVGINNSNPPQLQVVFIKTSVGDLRTTPLSDDCPNYGTYQTMLPHNAKVFLTKQ